ncbi:uncharacterized protein ATNIH1004_010712 [Aspergillus tanneri]|uniref:Uncharacterized protein n=1 Tax=Aspergillus tanneri TaxID=1220188 RepID=A0A5M9MA28_9EURO|nr:uncharacterized protein ATNIH1004_010712 [Aspergillus tanneri]KAA8641773.1 hypothetical protein ATNIH1004_010712 [Aspergillus tanneri]
MARLATYVTAECDSTLLRRKSKTTSAQGISSHTAGIAWSWFVVTIPITGLMVALLVMVFHYSLNHGDYPFESLRLPSVEDESDVLYVSLNSGIILFVTSWASSLAPYCQGSCVDRLPTPYQLALTLKLIDGSALGGIWNWILYLFSWRKNRQPQTPPLVVASSVAGLATILGLLVSVADTWLHLTTSTAPFIAVFNCSAAFNGLAGGAVLESAFFEGKLDAKTTDVVPDPTEFVQGLHGTETVSNTSVSNVWQTSVSYNNDFCVHNFRQATQTAIFSATGQDFANKVAMAFSKMTLAMGARGVDQQPALAAQEQETVLAARIPRAPLLTLVVFSLLYVLYGLILTALAVWAARRKIPHLQAGLSIAGLVTDQFKEPSSRCKPNCVKDMFEEHLGKADKRVGIESIGDDRTYRYIARKTTQGSNPVTEL